MTLQGIKSLSPSDDDIKVKKKNAYFITGGHTQPQKNVLWSVHLLLSDVGSRICVELSYSGNNFHILI